MSSPSTLRHRATTAPPTTLPTTTTSPTRPTNRTRPFLLDALRILTALILLLTLSSYLLTSGSSYTFHLRNRLPTLRSLLTRQLALTTSALAMYDGNPAGTPIYLAINRTVYDVSASPHVYGPGGMYATLAAKDASRSYITTCFEPGVDLVPWLEGVEEVYVPLWLSRRPQKEELEELVKEGAGGKSGSQLVDEVRGKFGDKVWRRLQDEAYEMARERVKQQVGVWEAMFVKKGYPVVGSVVGVDETRGQELGFCDKAVQQRPDMAKSLAEAMKIVKAGKGQGV